MSPTNWLQKKNNCTHAITPSQSSLPQVNLKFIRKKENNDFDLNDFLILEKVGRGGFSQVYCAYCDENAEIFALKKLDDEKRPILLEAIYREDDLLKKVEAIRKDRNFPDAYRYFPKYFGLHKAKMAGEGKKSHVFLMEFGVVTLEKIIKAAHSFKDESEILFILKELIAAFAILQENRIAHRDVKSCNIILIEDPRKKDNYFYKILDFGIGIELESKYLDNISSNTVYGYTECYAAPEIQSFINDKLMRFSEFEAQYNPFLADVYSLGLMVLEIMGYKVRKDSLWISRTIQDLEMNDYTILSGILKRMLEENPFLRPDFLYLKSIFEEEGYVTKPPNMSRYVKLALKIQERKMSHKMTNKELQDTFEKQKTLYEFYDEHEIKPAHDHLQNMSRIRDKIKNKNSKINHLLESSESEDEDLEQIFVSNAFGKYYLKMGNFCEAEKYFLENVRFYKRFLQENDERFLQKNDDYAINLEKKYRIFALTFQNLGLLNENLRNFSQAEEFYCLSLKLKNEKIKQPDSLLEMTDLLLANLYQKQGFFQKSQIIYNNNKCLDDILKIKRLNFFATLLQNKGEFKIAKNIYLEALKINGIIFREKHMETAHILGNLAGLYEKTNDFDKSKMCLLKSLEIFKNILGENHLSVSNSLINLGDLYEKMRNNRKAEQIYWKAFKINVGLYGETFFYNAIIYNNLGVLSEKNEKLLDAKYYYLQALTISEKIYGKIHDFNALFNQNLSNLCVKMGDFEKTQKLFLNVLIINSNLHGVNHFKTAHSFLILGNFYKKKGELLKSVNCLKRSIEILTNMKTIYRRYDNAADLYYQMRDFITNQDYLMKKKHPLMILYSKMAEILMDLGVIYHQLGNFSEAKKNLRNSLNIKAKLFDNNDWSIAIIYSHLGRIQHDKGNFCPAKKFDLKSLNILKLNATENNDQIAYINCYLGSLYEKKNNSAKAEKYYLDSLNMLEENHYLYLFCINSLGRFYFDSGNFNKAKDFFLKSSEISKINGRENSLEMADSYKRLGIYYKSVDISMSEKYFFKALEIIKKLPNGKNSNDYFTIACDLANLYYVKGNLTKAELYYLKSLESLEKNGLKTMSWPSAIAYNNLGNLYEKNNEMKKAEEVFLKSLEIIENHEFKEKDFIFNSILRNLFHLYMNSGNELKAKELINGKITSIKKINDFYHRIYENFNKNTNVSLKSVFGKYLFDNEDDMEIQKCFDEDENLTNEENSENWNCYKEETFHTILIARIEVFSEKEKLCYEETIQTIFKEDNAKVVDFSETDQTRGNEGLSKNSTSTNKETSPKGSKDNDARNEPMNNDNFTKDGCRKEYKKILFLIYLKL